MAYKFTESCCTVDINFLETKSTSYKVVPVIDKGCNNDKEVHERLETLKANGVPSCKSQDGLEAKANERALRKTSICSSL